jgi:hypothetical protein
MHLLEEALVGMDCQIIISSSWRFHHPFEYLQSLFPESLRGQVAGVTGDAFVGRWPRHSESSLTSQHSQAAGGRITGPRTKAGKARIAAAMTVHGNSTRQARAELSAELMQLAMLEELALSIGMITTRSRGRRPGYRKE